MNFSFRCLSEPNAGTLQSIDLYPFFTPPSFSRSIISPPPLCNLSLLPLTLYPSSVLSIHVDSPRFFFNQS